MYEKCLIMGQLIFTQNYMFEKDMLQLYFCNHLYKI